MVKHHINIIGKSLRVSPRRMREVRMARMIPHVRPQTVVKKAKDMRQRQRASWNKLLLHGIEKAHCLFHSCNFSKKAKNGI